MEVTVTESSPTPKDYRFVAKGNVYITANVRKQTRAAGKTLYVVLDRDNKRQLGLRCPLDVYISVHDAERATREDRKAAVEKNDAADAKKFEEEILSQFPGAPRDEVPQILKRALEKRSGRVGRTGRITLEERVRLAVAAHVRHVHTDYDDLLRKENMGRGQARAKITGQHLRVMNEWMGKPALKAVSGKKAAAGPSGAGGKTKAAGLQTSATSDKENRWMKVGSSTHLEDRSANAKATGRSFKTSNELLGQDKTLTVQTRAGNGPVKRPDRESEHGPAPRMAKTPILGFAAMVRMASCEKTSQLPSKPSTTQKPNAPIPTTDTLKRPSAKATRKLGGTEGFVGSSSIMGMGKDRPPVRASVYGLTTSILPEYERPKQQGAANSNHFAAHNHNKFQHAGIPGAQGCRPKAGASDAHYEKPYHTATATQRVTPPDHSRDVLTFPWISRIPSKRVTPSPTNPQRTQNQSILPQQPTHEDTEIKSSNEAQGPAHSDRTRRLLNRLARKADFTRGYYEHASPNPPAGKRRKKAARRYRILKQAIQHAETAAAQLRKNSQAEVLAQVRRRGDEVIVLS